MKASPADIARLSSLPGVISRSAGNFGLPPLPPVKNPTPRLCPKKLIPFAARLVVELPLQACSEANKRDSHWAERYRRTKAARRVWEMAAILIKPPTIPPSKIHLHRLGLRLLDSHDNLRASCKFLVDAIAAWLSIDDGKLAWTYTQEKSERYGVVVTLEWGGA